MQLGEASGTKVVNDYQVLTSNTFTTPVQELPANTTGVTVNVRVASVRGTGTSNTYYYRKVDLRVGYCTTSGGTYSWTTWTSHAIGATLDPINVSRTVAMPYSGKWYIKVEYAAADAGGTFTTGATEYDYNTATVVGGSQVSGEVDASLYSGSGTPYNKTDTKTITLPLNTYSPPSGWSVYQVAYSYEYAYYLNLVTGVYQTGEVRMAAPDVLHSKKITYASGSYTEGDTNLGNWASKTVTTASYSTTFISSDLYAYGTRSINGGTTAKAKGALRNGQAIIYIRKVKTNSTTPSNQFDTLSANYELSSAQVLSSGVVNWIAIGEH